MKLYQISKNIESNAPSPPQYLMADFYLLSTMASLAKTHERISLKVNKNILYSIQEANNKLLNELKNKLLRDLFLCIAAEFRHVISEGNTSESVFNESEYDFGSSNSDFLHEFYAHFTDSQISSASRNPSLDFSLIEEETGLSEEEIIKELGATARIRSLYSLLKMAREDSMENVILKTKSTFDLDAWDHSFGGKSWSAICIAWLNLNKAKTMDEKMIAIDRIYDLEHNSGNVFDKLSSYEKNNDDHAWISSLLDFKYAVVTLWGLYDVCSSDCKRMVAPTIKALEGTTYEQYANGQIEAIPDNIEESSIIASRFAMDVVGHRYAPLEPVIQKNANSYIQYISTLKIESKHFEKKMAEYARGEGDWVDSNLGKMTTNEISNIMVSYCNDHGKAVPEFEEFIAKNDRDSYHYAKLVLRGRFIQGEEAIATSRYGYATAYARDVLKGRFKKAEPNIFANYNYPEVYSYLNSIPELIPEGIEYLLGMFPQLSFSRLLQFIKYVADREPQKKYDPDFFISLLVENGGKYDIIKLAVNKAFTQLGYNYDHNSFEIDEIDKNDEVEEDEEVENEIA